MRGFLTGFFGACLLALIGAQLAVADIQGGCLATAIGSKSGTTDLTSAQFLFLQDGDVLAVRGTAPRPQTRIQVTVYLFGLAISLPQFSGLNEVADSQSQIQVSSYSRFARVLALSAATDNCTASLMMVVDDRSPVFTALGGAGAVLGLLGLLGMLRAAFGKGRFGSRFGGGLAGLFGGAGISLLLQQMLWIDPRSTIGLVPPAAGLILGIALAGTLRRAPKPAAEAEPLAPKVEPPASTPEPPAPAAAPAQ